MRRLSAAAGGRLAIAALGTLGVAFAPRTQEPVPVRLGAGEHVYEWVPEWLQLPDEVELGNTHGGFAFDAAGRVYFNTDSERAVVVAGANGEYARAFGEALVGGLHGMAIVREGEREVAYLAHQGQGRVVKATLEGEVLWEAGPPAESGVYGEGARYKPTSVAVAPGNRVFVADGYGAGYVHELDNEGHWVRTFGGPGTEDGNFKTPHGLCVDVRGKEPRLVVADRENSRLQVFTLDGEHLATHADDVRRPCSASVQGDDLVVADLNGRVTILDAEFRLIAHLGDNPDQEKWANNGVPREEWRDGLFLAPHHAAWDAAGDLYVMDWNRFGRVAKLRRVKTAEDRDG